VNARRALAIAFGCFVCACGESKPPAAPPPDASADEARGVALLESYDETNLHRAIELLGDVVARHPAWREARINFAIALASTKAVGDTAAALDQCERILAEDPREPHALFVAAMARRFQGHVEEAVPLLERLLEVDPDEPSVWYWLGAVEMEGTREDLGRAERYLRRALELAPGDGSSAYALHQALSRAGKADTAEGRALEARVRGEADAKEFGSGALVKHLRRGDQEYGEGGRYARAIRDFGGPTRAMFADAGTISGPAAPVGSASGVACGDADGDGDDDLYLPSAKGPGMLLRNDGGAFVDVSSTSGLPATPGASAALFADFDEDGLLDLTVVGDGVRLLRNTGSLRFTELSPERVGGPAGPCLGPSWADVDHDGDVDLVLAGASARWLRNRRDGSFADATVEKAVRADAATAVVAFDADADAVTDLVFFGPAGPPRLLRNGRLGPFIADPRFESLGAAVSGTVGDADGDGNPDLVLVRESGALALARGDGRGGFALDPTFPTLRVGASFAAVGDFDGDGHPDVLAVGRRVTVIRGLGGARWRVEGMNLSDTPRSALALSDFDGDGDLDAVVLERGMAPRMLRNEAARGRHVLRLALRGVPDRVEGRTWSNVRGIGAEVEVKAGDLLARRIVLCGSGFPGQATTDVVVGLGDRAHVDSVYVHWTDGVLQSELGVAPDVRREIVEVNRKMASCPVIFGWDGASYRYVTDCLGVGGLAFYSGPAVGYAPPDPTEVLLLPPLAAKYGAFVVKLLENLEEVSYLDEARLLVVDHPAEMEIHPDERFAVEAPFPEDRIYGAIERIAPAAATDDAGEDVLAALLAEDRDTVRGFALDRRFIGVSAPHTLTLEFGKGLASARTTGAGDRLVLFLSGWVEYGYSKTYVGQAQAGVDVLPPTLEIEDGAGGWKKAATMGYPAGNTRTMTYDVTGMLGPAATRCRIRTNQEVYWDRAFVAYDRAPGRIRTTTLPAAAAELSERGYPREFSPDGRAPALYDYGTLDASIPFRTTAGDYTRFGDVTPLVTTSDDRFVIFGKGEEVSLRFDATRLPALREGEARTFLLRLDGYCKDRDPYTALGDTVGPLPFHAMSNYPYPATEHAPDDAAHREYRARWNTRTVR
jgi:Flp pilus assembly protein TadD